MGVWGFASLGSRVPVPGRRCPSSPSLVVFQIFVESQAVATAVTSYWGAHPWVDGVCRNHRRACTPTRMVATGGTGIALASYVFCAAQPINDVGWMPLPSFMVTG